MNQGRSPRSSRTRKARVAAIGAIVSLALAAIVSVLGSGCEAVVSGVLPAYSCAGVAAEVACPANEVCFQPLGQCVAASAVCDLLRCPAGSRCDANSATCLGEMADSGGPNPFDASLHEASAPLEASASDTGGGGDMVDTSLPPPPADAQTACRGLGCRCAGIDDCDSRVCGDALTLGADVVAATSSNVCTKPCCTSLDCDPTTVCFAAGTGGNYCIKPSVLGRKIPTKRGAVGAACASDIDCASSRCASNACVDTCCSAASAASNTPGACPAGFACALGPYPGIAAFDNHYTFTCMPSAGHGADGDNCQRPADCRSAVCASTCALCGSSCRAPCRNTAACPSGEVCADVQLSPQTSTNDVGLLCAAATTTLGAKAIGSACANDFECRSGFCDTKVGACVDVCLGDSDCTGAPAGWHCRPTTVAILGQGSYSVSRCGP